MTDAVEFQKDSMQDKRVRLLKRHGGDWLYCPDIRPIRPLSVIFEQVVSTRVAPYERSLVQLATSE